MQNRTCCIDGCPRPAGVPGSARGMCRAHYKRWQKYGDPNEPLRRYPSWDGQQCAADGCDREVYGHGLCQLHWARQRRLGSLELSPPRTCTEPGCSERHAGRGLCRAHYDKTYRTDRNTETAEVSSHRRNRARARAAKAKGSHTIEEWRAKLDEYDGRCAYCDEPATGRDHVVPLSKGGSDWITNVVPACNPCNAGKANRPLKEWMNSGQAESSTA